MGWINTDNLYDEAPEFAAARLPRLDIVAGVVLAVVSALAGVWRPWGGGAGGLDDARAAVAEAAPLLAHAPDAQPAPTPGARPGGAPVVWAMVPPAAPAPPAEAPAIVAPLQRFVIECEVRVDGFAADSGGVKAVALEALEAEHAAQAREAVRRAWMLSASGI